MIKLDYHIIFESLSLIVAIAQYKKFKGSFMITFIPFIAIILGTELLAKYKLLTGATNNTYLYNALYPLMVLFFTWILSKLTSSKRQRLTLSITASTYLISYIIFNSVESKWSSFTPSLFAIGGLQLIVFACMYFYHYLRSDYPSSDKEHVSGLWIAAGLLIFYSGVFIAFSLHKYIVAFNLRIGGIKLHNFIPRVLSIPLYSCFIVSFLIWKPNPARK